MSATETTVIFAKLEALKDIKYIYKFTYPNSFLSKQSNFLNNSKTFKYPISLSNTDTMSYHMIFF